MLEERELMKITTAELAKKDQKLSAQQFISIFQVKERFFEELVVFLRKVFSLKNKRHQRGNKG